MVERFQFHYRQQGYGPVILFLHGFMGSGRDFNGIMPRLSQYTCLTLDLPDHGQTVTVHRTAYAMAEAAVSILDWLSVITPRRCALVGYSMGGRLALYLALTAPERFSHLLLESASPGLKTAAEQAARIAQDKARSQQIQQDFEGFLQRWYQAPMFRSLAQQPNFEAVLQRRRQNSPEALGRSLRCLGTGQQPSLWPHLHKLTLPTLLIAGEQDKKFCAISAEMAQQIPNAALITVPGCGHTVHLESPERYAKAIAALVGTNAA